MSREAGDPRRRRGDATRRIGQAADARHPDWRSSFGGRTMSREAGTPWLAAGMRPGESGKRPTRDVPIGVPLSEAAR